jgi:TonB family protein
VKVRYRPPDPDYPALARRNGIQGAVTVGVTIGADGVPIRAQALGGPGLLRAAAEGNALAWRFEPYRVAGVATICWIPLPFTFRLKP